MRQLSQEVYDLLGMRLKVKQEEAFATYASELAEWNERINLTAIHTPVDVRVKHFLDSASCLLVMRERAMGRIVDVGTGAGFPGLPLKILCPKVQVTLVESIGKKADFCRHIVQVLGLEGVEVLAMRAEEVGHMAEHRGRYDWAVARAVAPMGVLAEYLLPLLKRGGHMLAQKGERGAAEAQAAEEAIGLLGGRLRGLTSVKLPGVVEERTLVVAEKVAATPDKYPRRAGMPAKRPL